MTKDKWEILIETYTSTFISRHALQWTCIVFNFLKNDEDGHSMTE